jgi:energy-coupling factor transport system substrate-specific component
MKEVFSMWKHTKMVVLVALCAGLYAALLIPFKAIVLIPGITEVRPASALPIVFGLLFGPAGAWGAAIGNLIGDFFGSLGAGSIFGFVGNFLFAYVPYKLWNSFGFKEPKVIGKKNVIMFILIAILGSMACALFIAWGVDLLGLVPFAALGSIITANNTIPSIVLGLPLIILLYPRVKKWDLLWTDIVDESELPQGGAKSRIGGYIMIASILFGLIAGLITALGGGQEMFSFAGEAKNMMVAVIAGIGSIGILIGGAMQK